MTAPFHQIARAAGPEVLAPPRLAPADAGTVGAVPASTSPPALFPVGAGGHDRREANGPLDRVRPGRPGRPDLLGRHRGHLLAAVAVTCIAVATTAVVLLGARSGSVVFAAAIAWLWAWPVIER